MSEFKTRTSERESNVENILRGIHNQRQTEITNVLKDNRKPEDYLRRMDREDKRYNEVKESLRRYFLSADEWKKEEEGVEYGCSYSKYPDQCFAHSHQRCVPSEKCKCIFDAEFRCEFLIEKVKHIE
jgi:hypothetical protein